MKPTGGSGAPKATCTGRPAHGVRTTVTSAAAGRNGTAPPLGTGGGNGGKGGDGATAGQGAPGADGSVMVAFS
ncbi:hypothetical protein CTZ27_12150 [Streptomyces griseocarneus]|nr:hypothetical protein CTZ27_12150 [Streptomyces griseocarneus]